ncbi:MAG: HAD family hydrolase [Chloroflexota bacterium]
MIRAVIFDLGGTLLEYKLSGADWVQFESVGAGAAYDYLAGQRLVLPSRERFVAHTVEQVQTRWRQVTENGGNLRLADLLCDVCAGYGLALSFEQVDRAVWCYVQPLSAQVQPLPGAAETLHKLRQRGLKIGLISNTMWPGCYHLADLARHGLDGCFHHTLFSADVGVWKPHAQVFQRSLAALGVAPHEAVFVGDFLPHDIAGAQGVGMRGVHIVTNTFAADSVLPDGRIYALAELPELLARWQASSAQVFVGGEES